MRLTQKQTLALHARIQVRAYYLHINGSQAGHLADWYTAETTELALFEKRSQAGKLGAAARAYNKYGVTP